MKKFFLFASLALFLSTCTTDVDLLDNWKETTVIYGLLNQADTMQYIRIQKAFLGPDNAYTMAQEFDSINYINQLDVRLEELYNGNVINSWPLYPDTISNKAPGIFSYPMQVVYALHTGAPSFFNTAHQYHLVVKNNQTGNTADATTSLMSDFNMIAPQGPSISIVKINSNTMNSISWGSCPKARIFQVGLTFHYSETDVNNNTVSKATPEWMLGTVYTDSLSALDPQSTTFDPNDFYRFIANNIPQDPNVVSRKDEFITITVYAGGEALYTYMETNGASNSVVQDRPFYTNINNGLGIFSARYGKSKTNLTLTPLTIDTLAMGQFTCGLRFKDRNGVISAGCQ
ncbi:MAG TPA: DUF4249 family protein [Bacteroidia bacterium]|nr:DUF4249 family protein [Bacteroidia bacterium]